jgi:hypothetical protein
MDVFVLKEAAKVAVAFGLLTHLFEGLLPAAAMDFGYGHEVGVFLFLEIQDVPLANQAVTDEANANALVGAENTLPARGAENRGSTGLHEGTSAKNRIVRLREEGFHK